MPEKEILSIKEVAAMLGCSLSHVRNLLKGKVPNVPRIPLHHQEEYLPTLRGSYSISK